MEAMDTFGYGYDEAIGRRGEIGRGRLNGDGASVVPAWARPLLIGGAITAGGLIAIVAVLGILNWLIAHGLDGILFWTSLAVLVNIVLFGCDRGGRRRPRR